MKKLDLNTWKRKEHFEFFSKMDNPFFGIVTKIDCTKAYEKSKENGFSFFAYYLHNSITAINNTEEFKLRIIDGQVFLHNVIHAGTAILREDKTFAFAFIPFSQDFGVFSNDLQKEIENVKNSTGLRFEGEKGKTDLVQYSVVPWFTFSGVSHPRNFNTNDSIPKITFGKITRKENKMLMPLSIDAHHGLVDGFHIGEYLSKFQDLLNA
jgi:chloramphenicol O-acetyltransferase type A